MSADQAAREAALDPKRSFIVQAPAGSGKTELLVQRYVRLLATVEKPEEILAITFTRKAAAEMRLRVLKELPSPEAAHRLRIQTIDAFCAALTRQMPVLARFGAQPEIVEDATDLYFEAAGRVFLDLNESSERLLRHLDNDVGAATVLLADMLRRRDQWLRKTGAAPTREELEKSFVAERTRLLDRARVLHPKASQDLARALLTVKGTWRKNEPAAQAHAGDEPLRQALATLLRMPPEAYEDAQWEALEAILSLLLPAVATLKVVFAETGQVDFTEVAHGALLALGTPEEPADLLLSLDYRIRHILVDEFQDTSYSQFELIEKLTSGWERGDGRTLFVVGDPMQSIYRFREAEVSLFLRTASSGIGTVRLEPLTLSANFRSQENLVSWFNAAFPTVLPARADENAGAVPYSPSSAEKPALPGEAAAWHLFGERAAEAARVVDIVRQAKGKSAILVRNRAHLDEIVPALKDAGVPWRAVDIEQLGEKQVVQDLYALTRALTHLGDRIAWLACLRAPWCGLLLHDLHFLSQHDRTIWELINDDLVVCKLSEDGRKRLMRCWEPLGQALINRLRGTLRERVERTWLALGGPACVQNATELADAGIFLDELERLEEAGEVDMAALAERLEKLYALPDVEAGPEAVEIMTIHRAKGLEFDTVIVPGLDRLPRSGPRPLLAWKAGPDSLLMAPINETGSDDEPMYNYVRSLEAEAEDLEAGRLFYVAATRARECLHLLACVKLDEQGDPAAPSRRSLLAKIWPFLAPRVRELLTDVAPVPAEEPAVLSARIRRLAADFALPPPPALAPWTPPPQGREEAPIEFSWAGETARHVGTVVHRWLQQIAQDELKGWDAPRVDSLCPHFTRDLERRGVSPSDLKSAAERVATALKNTLADDRGRWILGPHPEARSEYRLRTALRTYIIDRMLKDTDGKRWVVDFKTSRHEGANVEAFLDEERKRYAAQLDAYAAALGGASRGLYFPVHSGWRDW